MQQRFDLSQEISVVVGGTGVLGGTLAKGLAEHGSKIVILGRNQEAGNATCDEIKNAGGVAHFISADATNRNSMEKALSEIEKFLGAPTVLVNAAGGNNPKTTVTPENPFENITLDAWEENFKLNMVGGALIPCQVFGPIMCKNKKGSIINIASVSAHIPLSRVVSYSASKAAVLNFTKFLAREWAPHGVRVNSLTPGFFPAEQNKKLLFNPDGTPTPRAQSIIDHTPMKRLGVAHELVGAAIFLASEAASGFVTGIDLRVDGGFLSQTI